MDPLLNVLVVVVRKGAEEELAVLTPDADGGMNIHTHDGAVASLSRNELKSVCLPIRDGAARFHQTTISLHFLDCPDLHLKNSESQRAVELYAQVGRQEWWKTSGFVLTIADAVSAIDKAKGAFSVFRQSHKDVGGRPCFVVLRGAVEDTPAIAFPTSEGGISLFTSPEGISSGIANEVLPTHILLRASQDFKAEKEIHLSGTSYGVIAANDTETKEALFSYCVTQNVSEWRDFYQFDVTLEAARHGTLLREWIQFNKTRPLPPTKQQLELMSDTQRKAHETDDRTPARRSGFTPSITLPVGRRPGVNTGGHAQTTRTARTPIEATASPPVPMTMGEDRANERAMAYAADQNEEELHPIHSHPDVPIVGTCVPLGMVTGQPVMAVRPDEDLGVSGDAGHECAFCGLNGTAADLFRPCPCPRVWHRECFREWRLGWINPRNYYQCIDCMADYRIERTYTPKAPTINENGEIEEGADVDIDAFEDRDSILATYRLNIFKLWITIVVFVIGGCSAISLMTAHADRGRFNIPLTMKFMVTSVWAGWPPEGAAQTWREEFNSPDTYKWPYYMLFGMFLTSLIMLTFFAIADQYMKKSGAYKESSSGYSRGSRPCYRQCGCHGTGGPYCCYCGNVTHPCHNLCDSCCTSCGNCADCNFSGGCGCGGGSCKGDGLIVVFVILIVLVLVVLISAPIVAVLWAMKRSAEMHSQMTDLFLQQALELEGRTIVLGMDENLRPIDEV